MYAATRAARADALAQAGLSPLTMDVTRPPASFALPAVDPVLFVVRRDRTAATSLFDIHVTGLRAVLGALPGSTGRVVYVSSTGVYGQDSGDCVDEESECEPAHEGGSACLAGDRLLFAPSARPERDRAAAGRALRASRWRWSWDKRSSSRRSAP